MSDAKFIAIGAIVVIAPHLGKKVAGIVWSILILAEIVAVIGQWHS